MKTDDNEPINSTWARREWGICGSGVGFKIVRLRKCIRYEGPSVYVVEVGGECFDAVNTKGKLRTLMTVLGYSPAT